MEQTTLFNAANFQMVNHNDNNQRWGLFGNQTVCSTRLSQFLCPSCPPPSWTMPGLRYTAVAPGNNYFASVGSTLEFDATQTGGAPNGLFRYIGPGASSVTLASITDGTSNTVAFGEWRIGDGSTTIVDPTTDVSFVSTFPAGVTRNTPTMSLTNNLTSIANFTTWLSGTCVPALASSVALEDSYTTGQDWAFGVFGDSMGTMDLAPNPPFPSCLNMTFNGGTTGNKQDPGVFPLTSFHPGGANVLMADGSVRFLKNTTSLSVIWALGSRNQGEVITSDSY
jgi:prepilin-type processing-associated H-X9-DG protein